MALFVMTKKQATGPRSLGGDIYVSKQAAGTNKALAIRIAAPVMDRLRWRSGDKVIAEFDKQGDTGVWTLRRTEDDNGLTISQKKLGNAGQVKSVVSADAMKQAIPNGKTGYVGTLETVKGDSAVFLIDYAS